MVDVESGAVNLGTTTTGKRGKTGGHVTRPVAVTSSAASSQSFVPKIVKVPVDGGVTDSPRQNVSRTIATKRVQRVNSAGMANALAMGKANGGRGNGGKGKRNSTTSSRNIERPDDL